MALGIHQPPALLVVVRAKEPSALEGHLRRSAPRAPGLGIGRVGVLVQGERQQCPEERVALGLAFPLPGVPLPELVHQRCSLQAIAWLPLDQRDTSQVERLRPGRLLELERHVVDLSRVERAASNPSHEPPRGPRQDERLAVEGRQRQCQSRSEAGEEAKRDAEARLALTAGEELDQHLSGVIALNECIQRQETGLGPGQRPGKLQAGSLGGRRDSDRRATDMGGVVDRTASELHGLLRELPHGQLDPGGGGGAPADRPEDGPETSDAEGAHTRRRGCPEQGAVPGHSWTWSIVSVTPRAGAATLLVVPSRSPAAAMASPVFERALKMFVPPSGRARCRRAPEAFGIESPV